MLTSRTNRQNLGAFDELGLPWDLTQWVAADELLQVLARQLESIDWHDPKLTAFEKRHPEFRPKMFLTLLPYAYAAGMYGSQDIAEGCYTDLQLKAICAGDPPTARDIAAFRRENRGLLQWLLVELFKHAIKKKYDSSDFFVSLGLKRSLADAAMSRLDAARHMDRGAAELE